MRSTLSLLGLLGSLGLAAGAVLAACGDTVVTNNLGAGGQGGTGGAPGTTVTTTATTTTTSTTTTSTSTGMMSLCDQACSHAAGCGVDVCSFAMIDCANPQTDCPAQCLLDANCVQILSLLSQNPDPTLIGCITGCQGGTGGGGGGGPGGSCQGCAFQSCGTVLQSCGTPECQAWQQCAQGCSDPQCFADCNAQNPGAAAYYGDVYDCLCTSCETDCAMTADPCNPVIPGTGGAGGMGMGGMGMGGMGMGGMGGMP